MDSEFKFFPSYDCDIDKQFGKFSKEKIISDFYVSDIEAKQIEIARINAYVVELQKRIEMCENNISFSKRYIKFQPIFILLMSLGAFTLGGLFHINNFLIYGFAYGIMAISISTIYAGINTIGYSILKRKSRKKIKHLSSSIEKVKNIKLTYEKEIEQVQDLEIQESTKRKETDISLKQENIIEPTEINHDINKPKKRIKKI